MVREQPQISMVLAKRGVYRNQYRNGCSLAPDTVDKDFSTMCLCDQFTQVKAQSKSTGGASAGLVCAIKRFGQVIDVCRINAGSTVRYGYF